MVHEAIGIRHGQITTIHDPTNTNLVVDAPHKDLRRARSAMLSLAPTTTGSATAIALIYPELKGKLNGHAVRAPVLNASLTDCVFELQRETTAEEVNALFARRGARAAGRHPGLRGARRWSAPTTRATRAAASSTRSSTHGHRRHAAEGLRLVRQRDGLRLPHGRPGLPHARGRASDRATLAMNTGTRNYAIVTAAYWGFTLTDGALRMLVLLHFYRLGYSPFTLAFLFLLYEAAGIVANLIGGWLATRYGIARMLAVGLATQITGFLLLSALSPDWTAALSVAWVVLAQGVCGVAKDLTKTASKSAIKLTAGDASGQLFKWVAFFTGSKNAMKGVGFFLGGLLLQALGFQQSLWAMAALLALVLVGVVAFVPPLMGKSQGLEVGARNCSPRTAASTCWPPRAWCCSARATCGSWSACRCSCTRRAGPSRWSAASSRCGPSATAWCRRWRPRWCGAATTA